MLMATIDKKERGWIHEKTFGKYSFKEDFEIVNVNGDGLITKIGCKICSKHTRAIRGEARRSKYTNNVSHLRIDRVSLNHHFMFTARKNSVFSSNPTDPKFEFSMFFVINLEDQPSQYPTAR